MNEETFRLPLYLPAQGASEIEATIIEWFVAEGDRFDAGQVLAQAESAKSVFDFEAPCEGLVIRLRHLEGETVSLAEPVLDVETSDVVIRDWIPPAAAGGGASGQHQPSAAASDARQEPREVGILGMGGYLPARVVSNGELVSGFPEVTEEYVYQVTGVRQRRWAADGEKPSTMALAASLEAIRRSGVATKDIDAVIVATTTPDAAMPSTACILQECLGLNRVPAFDLNAACSGWLYAVSMARAMIIANMAQNVLTVGVEMQSRLLDPSDRSAYFIFGDGAGAAVISSRPGGHRICHAALGADTQGIHLARRDAPGYLVPNGNGKIDPWIRLDGQALFRFATESFGQVIREAIAQAGWTVEETRWIVPHQANGRILKAAAKRSQVAFERFVVNIDRLGNTSSASIPLALVEVEDRLRPGDKLILCSVGAGMTTAAIAVQW